MKTIILYGTTYGCSKACAEQLSSKLEGEVALVNLMLDSAPSLDPYDQIIVGGSIYMGQVHKKIKNFCAEHGDSLLQKRLALFLNCGVSSSFDQYIENNFSPDLVDHAVIKSCFGGELNPTSMTLLHRFVTHIIVKAGAKSGLPPVEVNKNEILHMADVLNSNEIRT